MGEREKVVMVNQGPDRRRSFSFTLPSSGCLTRYLATPGPPCPM